MAFQYVAMSTSYVQNYQLQLADSTVLAMYLAVVVESKEVREGEVA